MQLTEMKILWVFGALERLATLGLIVETPYQVTQDGIDTYLMIDEQRDNLFSEDVELKHIVTHLITENVGYADSDLIEGFYHLLKDYKNERERIVKYALSHQMA
jgi:hypothetical protein